MPQGPENSSSEHAFARVAGGSGLEKGPTLSEE